MLGIIATLPACGRTHHSDSPLLTQGETGTGGVSVGGASGTSTGGTASTAGTTTVEPTGCRDDEPTAPPALLLTDSQITHVAALFDESLGALQVPPLSRIYSTTEPTASAAFVERQLDLATRIAARAVAEPPLFARVVGCDFEARGAEACLLPLQEFVLTRLFRGLASEGTAEELESVYLRGVELGGDGPSGLRAVLEVALQAPEFLYRIEFGRPARQAGGWAEPTPREMASRLSFLLWDRGPDDALLAAADADELREPEQLAAQARRLLGDPRARDVVRRFFEELLAVGYADTNNPRAPELTSEIYAGMRSELGAFVEDATFHGAGDYAALFAPHTWVDPTLAAFYGFPPVSGGLQRVELDSARYAGLLTQGAWLTGYSADYTSPTRRGLLLSRALLCREIPPEPPGVEVTLPDPGPQQPQTTRQRLAQHASNPACQGCHQMMDPYGLALEHFDPVGRWRETENGLPLDTAVELYGGDPVDGAGELATWFLAQPETRACFVQNWRRFAFGRGQASAEDCEQDELLESFLDADENILELLVALTQTSSFRYLGKPSR